MRIRSMPLTLMLIISSQSAPLVSQEATPTLDEMQAMIVKQQELIALQSQQLEAQAEELAKHALLLRDMQTRIDEMAMAQGDSMEPTDGEILLRERIAELERTVQAEPEAPADVLRAGEFPGSIRLPGTNMAAKVGGFVRLGVVDNFDAIGTDDRFVVGTIPPAGTEEAGDARRVTISAKRSRLNLDLRMDSSVGQFRAFLEGDFAGRGGTDNYRLRHAFGQYNRFLLGQTWSTFMDNRATPEELDFEGLSGRLQVRQPLFRWATDIGDHRHLAIGLEDPAPSVTGGEGVSRFPDLTMRNTWSRKRNHLQTAAVLRGIRAQQDENPENDDLEFGWGVSVSGRHYLGDSRESDNFMFQLNAGRGIGRYINDLGSVGGQDAVFDPETGELEAVPAIGGYVAWEHWWRESDRTLNLNLLTKFFNRPRSTLVYSYVNVDNFDFQEPGAYDYTQRATANFIFSPISAIDLGLETLWGERTNKDGSKGDAFQLQLVATFRF